MRKSLYTMSILIVVLVITLSVDLVKADDYYVDPARGSMSNDGSPLKPWSTLQEVWESGKIATTVFPSRPVKSGDTIYLLSGYHGKLIIAQNAGAVNSDWITIKAAEGATPQIHSISLSRAVKWVFDGLSISYTYGPEPITKPANGALFRAESHNYFGASNNIILKNSTLFSYMDNSGWSASDWLTKTVNGVSINYMEEVTIDNCRMFNLAFAVAFTSGRYNTIKNSIIDGMSGDGIRMAGTSFSKIEHNTVKNLRLVDANHPDMIQLWALADSAQPDWMDYGGQNPQKGVEIRGNVLIANEDPNQTFASGAQGIGAFDGFFEDFIIENNLIVSSTTHGISLYGAINCKIINNTVASNPLMGLAAPISVLPHKNRTPGSGNVVKNNICSAFRDHTVFNNPTETIYGGVVESHNIKNISNSSIYDIFVDPDKFNFKLRATSAAINAGSKEFAPEIDLNKVLRDIEPDIGAYEYSKPNLLAPGNFRIDR